jgi:uncharacterized protein YkwD
MTVRSFARHAPTRPTLAVLGAGLVTLGGVIAAPTAQADNVRLNKTIGQNVYAIQRQAGCLNMKVADDMRTNPALELAAQWHADDIVGDPELDGDIGSDGSTLQDRARAAGYRGPVSETVATLASFAINPIDILAQWYWRPEYYRIMSNCANTEIGVRTVNSFNRSVTVAVYGQPVLNDAI